MQPHNAPPRARSKSGIHLKNGSGQTPKGNPPPRTKVWRHQGRGGAVADARQSEMMRISESDHLVLMTNTRGSPSRLLARDIVAIEPGGLKHGLVAAEALAQREFDVAFELRPGRGQMVLSRTLARPEHGRLRARHAQPLVGEQRRVEIVGVA